MFKIGTEETFPEVPDATVWSDDEDRSIFYALPNSPRLRTRNGVPQLKFVKYRGDVGDGKGGFVFFDADLSLRPDETTKLMELWQQRLDAAHAAARRRGEAPRARMGTMTYTRGTVGLLFEDDSAIVSRVAGAAKPSLYSTNVAPFMLELNEDQVPILEGAMKGVGNTGVTVLYDLYFWASMPPAEVTVDFNADRFEEYFREVDAESSWIWDDHYTEEVEATLTSNQFGSINVRVSPLPDPEATEKLKTKLRDWGFRMFNDAIAQQAANLLGLIPEDQKGAPQTYLDKLGGDDLDELKIDIDNNSFFDFNVTYRETSPIEWNLAPQGSLPSVESIKKPDSDEFYVWEDFVVEVEPDKFFDELHVYAKVNADFDRLPLHSVQVNIEHDGEKLEARPLVAEDGDSTFIPLIDSADDVLHFADFVDGVDQFDYWYEVNYKNESQTFVSEKTTIKAADREPLVINLDETGILSLDVKRGDIDFDAVALAEVVVTYEDPDEDIGPFEERYFIDKDTDDAQKFQRVVFGPRNHNYQYEVTKLRLADGTEIEGPSGETPGPTLHVDDIFTATRMVRCSAAGDLEDEIARIEVNITYSEPNGYRMVKNQTLDKGSPTFEWPIRVTSLEAGTLSCDGQIVTKQGEMRAIEAFTPASDSFAFGDVIELRMGVTVVPDGLFTDPDVLKVIFSGSYTDPETSEVQLLPTKIISRDGDALEPAFFEWEIDLRDDEHRTYEWEAKVLTTSGVGPDLGGTSDSTVLVPSMS